MILPGLRLCQRNGFHQSIPCHALVDAVMSLAKIHAQLIWFVCGSRPEMMRLLSKISSIKIRGNRDCTFSGGGRDWRRGRNSREHVSYFASVNLTYWLFGGYVYALLAGGMYLGSEDAYIMDVQLVAGKLREESTRPTSLKVQSIHNDL